LILHFSLFRAGGISTLWTFVSFSAREKDSFGIFGSISKPEKSFSQFPFLDASKQYHGWLAGSKNIVIRAAPDVILFKGVWGEGQVPILD
jgi:hypothetical protein